MAEAMAKQYQELWVVGGGERWLKRTWLHPPATLGLKGSGDSFGIHLALSFLNATTPKPLLLRQAFHSAATPFAHISG